MRKLISIVSIVGKFFVFAALVFVVFTFVASRTDKLGIRSFVVLTGSMQPTVPVGSVVYALPDWYYYPGDIIAFKNRADVIVTHRVVQKIYKTDGIYLQTRGDANNSADSELVPINKVIGKSQFSLPYLGRFSGFLKTPTGFLALIVLPALVIIGSELWSIMKEVEKNTREKVMSNLQQNEIQIPSA
jgi:signal peptidase